MKKHACYFIIQLLVIVLLTALWRIPGLLALEVPALKGRVNDTAGMLSPATRQQLEEILRNLEQTDSTQIVVLTIPSLKGEVLEEFSIRVAEKWKIGQKGFDNGAILLIAKNDRKIRIEVGYGLEGSLTDLTAGRIIRNVIVPQFKTGNFDQGVIDGVQAIIGVVRGEYTATEKVPTGGALEKKGISFWLGGLFTLFIFINLLLRLRRPISTVAGGIMAPVVAALFFSPRLIWVLLAVPIGLLAGHMAGLLGPRLVIGQRHSHIRYPRRRWSGGFGGGGFSSGGFGGGGGGFGGGGASGSW